MKKKKDTYDLDLANSIIQGFTLYLMDVMKVKLAERVWTDINTKFDDGMITSVIEMPLTEASPFDDIVMNIAFKRRQ